MGNLEPVTGLANRGVAARFPLSVSSFVGSRIGVKDVDEITKGISLPFDGGSGLR